ncbi:MAG: class I SAM-dependent methyltransferase [Rhodospirillaceae bacterium]|nr:MAG: class I SAM-dependent methyltransferase [Rhodospirillaceae bacterium]
MAARDRLWREKPVLRHIYHHLYARMRAACNPGTTLEIGGGTGIFKEFAPDTITTDVIAAPWLDLVADAQRLPFAAARFANIVMFDVLHHIEYPRYFLAEALRVLQPGGRLIMVEPAITPVSWLFYNFIHEEPVDLGADPLRQGQPSTVRDPFAANQAIPTLLVGRHRSRLAAAFPNLRLTRCTWLSLLAYPLSGGFKSWCAIPQWLVAPLLWAEDLLAPIVGRLAAFRLFVVFEKTG